MLGEIIFDALIAILAAVGLATVVWVLFDLFFEHSSNKAMYMCTVIAADGKSGDLKNAIQAYIWRYNAPTDNRQLFIADFGMGDKEAEYAQTAGRRNKNIKLIPADELYNAIILSLTEGVNKKEA